MRTTSLTAYATIRDSKLLSKRRWEVYEILFSHGPLTAHEVVAIARNKYPHANQTSFNARLSELNYIECVAVVGEKKNPISGCKNLLWDVTSKLPRKIEKSKREHCNLCGGKGYLEKT